MLLLDGKQIVVTGVVTPSSIAYKVAEIAITEGAEITLTGFGKGLQLTRRCAQRLPMDVPVVELDVTDSEQISAAASQIGGRWNSVDGVVHAIAFAPPAALEDPFLSTPWPDAATALHISTFSYAAVAAAFAPLLAEAGGGSYVGLTFDSSVVWPSYNWMGVAKAGLEAANRYVACELGGQGTRVNLVASGPLQTMAARSIPKFETLQTTWAEHAPLGWDSDDATATAKVVCALLSEWTPGVTGEIVHCDGGAHMTRVVSHLHGSLPPVTDDHEQCC